MKIDNNGLIFRISRNRLTRLTGGIAPMLRGNSFIPELRADSDEKTKKALYADALELGKISHGDELWFEKIKKNAAANPIKPLEKIANPNIGRDTAQTIAPSKTSGTYTAQSAEAQKFGSAVHAIFERIKFANGAPEECASRAAQAADIPADIREKAIEKVANVLGNPAYAPYFAPQDDTEVFTEYPFDALVGGKIVRGIIDRLMLKKSPDGATESATIIDYKSAILNTDAQTRQLELYREAVSKLYNLPKEKITTLICNYS